MPDNVIRFPKDWFGSTDDLVPIDTPDAGVGASARRDVVQLPSRRLRPVATHDDGPKPRGDSPGRVEGSSASVVSAEDFWGAQAESLHQPVGRVDRAEPPVFVADEQRARELRNEPDRVGAPQADRPEPGEASPTRRVRPRIVAVGALCVAAGIALALVAFHGNPVRERSSSGVRRSSAPVPHLLAVRPEPTTVSEPARGHAHRVAHAHRVIRVAPGPPRETAATATGASSAPSAAASSPEASGATDRPATEYADSSASDGSRSSNSASSHVSERSTSQTTGSGPAGPAGPGGVVGQNCNPKCS